MNGKYLAKLIVMLVLTLLSVRVEVKAQLPVPPDPFYQLNSWYFLAPDWVSTAGDGPLSFTNASNPASFDGNALQIDSTNAAWMQYAIEDAYATNINFIYGAVEMWVLPDWNSGTGPGDWGRLIEVGAYSTNSPSSWWSLYVSTDGTRLNFSSETNGVFTNYLSVPIAWDTNDWNYVCLTYSHVRSELYTNGVLAATGPGVFYAPSSAAFTNGFFVGSDATGTEQSRASINDLATYNYAISAYEISNDYAAGLQLINGGGFHTDSGGFPLPPGDGGDGTNGVEPRGVTYTPDYGTNLWIADPGISSNYFGGFASNTVADVEYEIQTIGDLTQTNWVSQGFFLGSETTNYTPLNPLPANYTTNCFVRLRSWADDGSGIPAWWELQYFGTNGVDPDAQDAAGDGWTIYQKYQMGLSPNVFYTPAAPANFSTGYNLNTTTETVTWSPSPGPVTGYTLKVDDIDSGDISNISLSATNTSFSQSVTAGDPDYDIAPYGPQVNRKYTLYADYGTNESAVAGALFAENGPGPVAQLVNGPEGRLYYSFQGLPSDLNYVRIFRSQNSIPDWYVDLLDVIGPFEDNESLAAINSEPIDDGYFNIPAGSITNGICELPDSQVPPYWAYNFWVQTVRSNGIASAWTASNPYLAGDAAYASSMPFIDARRQLKDNLIFLLRAADQTGPLTFTVDGTSEDGRFWTFTWPTNYAYADYSGAGLTPIYENYFYRNFAFDPDNLAPSGLPNTGCYLSASYPGITITNRATYRFDGAAFVTASNPTVPGSQLGSSQTQWIATSHFGSNGELYSEASVFDGETVVEARNCYGLPLISEQAVWNANNVQNTEILYPGDTEPYGNGICYNNFTPPIFESAGYYFARLGVDPVPENNSFVVPTNPPAIVVGLGNSVTVAGYNCLAVTNGYSGVFGYLGQYFDQAYQLESDGVMTANSAGILSPYGVFTPTVPGPAALVTMPDIDNGQTGTCMVYTVSLQLDANHDGKMDISGGMDATSPANPMVFWANNNFDRWFWDSDDETNYMDDVPRNSYAAWGYRGPNPDYDYPTFQLSGGSRWIPDTRDLEDFARLWVCGVNSNLLAALPTNSTITLSWGDVGAPLSSNPTIDLFAAADTDGGNGYLTNSVDAAKQIDITQCPFFGRLAPGGSIQLNANWLAGHWTGNYFIWCGVSNGTGGLTLTIADASSNVLARTTAYIQIKDIKQMYERWTVGELLKYAPKTNAILGTEDLPLGTPGFQYPPPAVTNTPYILYVHGWNMDREDKDLFAETAYKRLYWQGYNGRFGVFRWPTGSGFEGLATLATNPTEKDNFDSSEFNSWRSAPALLRKLDDLNAEYPGQVYMLAHSMGNVAAGEALRLSGSNQVVNAYAASQAAVSAHTYDPDTNDVPDYSFYYLGWSISADTPNIYGGWFSNSYSHAAGQIINLYNTNDFALSRALWQRNQLLKPDQDVLEGLTLWDYEYNGTVNDPAPWNHFAKQNVFLPLGSPVYFDIVNVLTNRYEVMAYAAQSYTTALGATPNVENVSADIYLGRRTNPIWQVDGVHPNHPFDEHYYHSAEFRGDYPSAQGYWSELLGSECFNLK